VTARVCVALAGYYEIEIYNFLAEAMVTLAAPELAIFRSYVSKY